jgi:hypothetical protein
MTVLSRREYGDRPVTSNESADSIPAGFLDTTPEIKITWNKPA